MAKCKQCGKKFTPMRITTVCSYTCAIAFNKEKEVEKRFKLAKSSLKNENSHKTLQDLINKIVRLIDVGHPCITSNVKFGRYTVHAGHYYPVGSHPQLRYNLLNIYAQSDAENTHKSGNGVVYSARLKEVFGAELRDEVEGLVAKYPTLRLTKLEASEKCKVARNIIRGLESMQCPISTEMRITLRKRLNESLGIYK